MQPSCHTLPMWTARVLLPLQRSTIRKCNYIGMPQHEQQDIFKSTATRLYKVGSYLYIQLIYIIKEVLNSIFLSYIVKHYKSHM